MQLTQRRAAKFKACFNHVRGLLFRTQWWIVVLGFVFSVPLSIAQVDTDPWESLNRRVFAFNEKADQWVLRPAAKAYVAVMPDRAEKSIRNFFNNLDQINSGFNSLLQLKWAQVGQCAARFGINTTVGVLGFFDVASRSGLPFVEEDFGQTLGFYGVKTGPYIMLPFYGPSTLRETAAISADDWLNPPRHVDDIRTRNSLRALSLLDSRASLLSVDGLVQGDRYAFVREAYLQRREYLVNDGHVKDDFLEDDW